MTTHATTLGYGIPTLALAAMCVTMPTELGIIAAGTWRVVELTWLPAVIVAGVACLGASKAAGR